MKKYNIMVSLSLTDIETLIKFHMTSVDRLLSTLQVMSNKVFSPKAVGERIADIENLVVSLKDELSRIKELEDIYNDLNEGSGN